MSLHKEINLETEIFRHLASHSWLNSDSDASNYDRARALFPADVRAWAQTTQPQAWETQALNSPAVHNGMKDILLNHSRLWETLRQRAAG